MRTWKLQTITETHHGYDWPVLAIRSNPANHCLAVVGDVDRATAGDNERNARLMAAAPELLAALAAVRLAASPASVATQAGDLGALLVAIQQLADAAIQLAEGGVA